MGACVTAARNILYYGSPAAVPEPIMLRAGALSVSFVAGELRHIRLGNREIVRRVYVAVRDRNWRTLPSSLLDIKKTIDRQSFELRFEVENKRDEIDFCWHGCVVGETNGTISFTMEGLARSTFWKNRIGFSILHPSAEWAGSSCQVETVDGKFREGQFPIFVAPQNVFLEMRAISHEAFPNIRANLRLEGDIYEMEDQRNWSDASYKTYCPPLNLPFPSEMKIGARVSQSVALHIEGDVSNVVLGSLDEPVVIAWGKGKLALPRIGLQVSSGKSSLSKRAVERLRMLGLAHLRVDLKMNGVGFEDCLRHASAEAGTLGVALEVAVFLTDAAQAEIKELRGAFDRIRPRVHAWLVFHVAEKSTSQKWLDLARAGLSDYNPAAHFGIGTDCNFAELNRYRPADLEIDLLSYALSPQVHLSDHENLVENLQAQCAMVQSARCFSSGARLAVTPVSLRPRSNPYATSIESPMAETELPLHVDARQMSLLAMVWTLGCLKNLAESRIYSTTFYETVGWGGVMETEAGSLLPAKFPSLGGAVFPVFHLFADVGEFEGGEVVPSSTSDSLRVQGLVLSKNGKLRIIMANLTPEKQKFHLDGAHSGPFELKTLDEGNAEFAMVSPEAFRAAAALSIDIDDNGADLELLPWSMMRLDRT
jgi:hypothetical protein